MRNLVQSCSLNPIHFHHNIFLLIRIGSNVQEHNLLNHVLILFSDLLLFFCFSSKSSAETMLTRYYAIFSLCIMHPYSYCKLYCFKLFQCFHERIDYKRRAAGTRIGPK
ncbi:hypothetical protein CW304_04395 [Bacillus sp. UFRGS-B20]|nr:hypothetical protein CW304_04395 [Bacillus sp. UFRGS-B20]